MLAGVAQAETLRVATFAAPLSRDGPGLLLRDILKGEDAGITAITDIIQDAAPDILLLADFDYDADGLALAAFAAGLDLDLTFHFARAPNAGVPTGLDLDGNGRLGDARDAQGYGRFAGDGGLAILSRFPIDPAGVTDFSTLLWRDLAGATLPQQDGKPFLDNEVLSVLRLSSTAHWVVPISLADGSPLTLLAFAATPPVFDGPEDMNGLRARDELRLWENLLDGKMGPVPQGVVVLGNGNLDPDAGQGDRQAMQAFLNRDDLQDPHVGSYNADWGEDGPGRLRVSYVLPSTDWVVVDAGTQITDAQEIGPHRLVWVDIRR
ncbi:MAG: endonuclease/exonuclease/phosphatase family protein [Yoonia sp.]|uniref:endonuclease/exonuclease/phosphatase family protein n=1 Tax=Yoonia sp. TaxID=2212373 RepID=UPI003EF3E091